MTCSYLELHDSASIFHDIIRDPMCKQQHVVELHNCTSNQHCSIIKDLQN